MPDIGFYVLASRSERERLLFVCKLAEKAYRSGSYSYILTESPRQSAALDDLLWTFRPGSFVPHQIYDGDAPENDKILLIGNRDAPARWRHVLINLSPKGPDDYAGFDRILEILDDSEETKTPGRIRYQQYRQSGFSVATHKIDRI
ncbi:MAG: DNA polymerase III subunit chi [Methylomicrobium sp.]